MFADIPHGISVWTEGDPEADWQCGAPDSGAGDIPGDPAVVEEDG